MVGASLGIVGTLAGIWLRHKLHTRARPGVRFRILAYDLVAYVRCPSGGDDEGFRFPGVPEWGEAIGRLLGTNERASRPRQFPLSLAFTVNIFNNHRFQASIGPFVFFLWDEEGGSSFRSEHATLKEYVIAEEAITAGPYQKTVDLPARQTAILRLEVRLMCDQQLRNYIEGKPLLAGRDEKRPPWRRLFPEISDFPRVKTAVPSVRMEDSDGNVHTVRIAWDNTLANLRYARTLQTIIGYQRRQLRRVRREQACGDAS